MRKLLMATLLILITSWSACATLHLAKFKKSQRPQFLDAYMTKFETEVITKDDRLDLDIFQTLEVLNYLENLEHNPTWE